jgi:BirA family biotin operon repressor/biotin-[acetyl-CoA-carboxylase] ligase
MAGAATALAGFAVHRFDSVGSTNTLALESRTHRAVFCAAEQTQGRGRRGNTWVSRPGLGLYLSVCLQGEAQGLTMAAALAVRDALAAWTPVAVKWPNDLLCGGRKICGILVEHRAGWNALGIGINLNHAAQDFPAELQEKATSLALATGRAWDAEKVLGAVLESLDAWLQRLEADFEAVHQAWVSACGLVGRRVAREGVAGVVQRIDMAGSLIVETVSGTVVLQTTEAELVGAVSCSS